MIKFAPLAALATVAVLAVPATVFAAESSQSVRAATDAAASTVAVNAGKMLYASNGQRIASIYRVTTEGNPQVILNGKLVTVPASTLSDVNGKVTTSLSKSELGRAQ
jgi:hypothetical protein